jgi:hypothetical protein
MKKYSEAFVGFDTAKKKRTVAIADVGGDGEVRYFGEIDSPASTVTRVIGKLAERYETLRVCYEAGPTGYGLYRQVRALGHDCTVVAPSRQGARGGGRGWSQRPWPMGDCCGPGGGQADSRKDGGNRPEQRGGGKSSDAGRHHRGGDQHTAIVGAAGAKLRDRSRSVKLRLLNMARAAPAKGKPSQERLERADGKLLASTGRAEACLV